MKKLYGATILLAFLLLCGSSYGQNFEKAYGGSSTDEPYATLQTADGGYIVAGRTFSFGNGYDVYVIKTNAAGVVQWSNVYGGGGTESANDMRPTSDGGYVITGATDSYGAGGSDFYLMKINSSGTVMWFKTYGGTQPDEAYSVALTSDGGYFLFGLTSGSFGQTANIDYYMVKTDGAGVAQWSNAIGVSNPNTGDEGIKAVQTSDGGYALYGTSASTSQLFIKLNAAGDSVFSKTYSAASGFQRAQDFEQTADGGYILTGYTTSFGIGVENAYLIKTTATGDISWSKRYATTTTNGEAPTRAHNLTITAGGYAVVGVGRPQLGVNTGTDNCLWFKTDASGANATIHMYGGNRDEIVYGGVKNTADGGYVYSAITQSYGAGSNDIFLVKTDANGAVTTVGSECTTTEALSALQTADVTFTTANPVLVFTRNVATINGTFTPGSSSAATTTTVVCPTVVLPLRSISLTATLGSNAVVLTWNTEQETHVANYTVERSANDGLLYTSVGTLRAKNGFSNSYLLTDFSPAEGKNLYRVRIEDADGKISYSPVAVISYKQATGWMASIMPNPVQATSKILVRASGINEPAGFRLTDQAGRLVMQKLIPVNTPVDFSKGQLSPGTYFYEIDYHNEKKITGKVVIE